MLVRTLENAEQIRARFIKKFLKAENNGLSNYEDIFMWDKMPENKYKTISFADALEHLRSIAGDVCFISEIQKRNSTNKLRIDGEVLTGFAAEANAKELADLIEYEWYEMFRSMAQDMYFDTVLPDDLYVFDASMDFLIVFTHENDYWDLEIEDPIKAADSRLCIAFGI